MKLIQVLAAAAAMVACGPDPAPVAPGGGSPVNPVAGPGSGGGEESSTDPAPGDPSPENPEAPTPDPAGPEDSPPPPDPPAPAPEKGVPESLRGILSAHNQVRARHCAPPLTWSAELARVAQKWANHMAASGCSFGHSGGKYGENLAAGSPNAYGPGDVVRMWYDEVGKYDFRKGGFSMETGHFTQVVWVDTRRVGCATATCKRQGMQLWVCNYDPPGNVQTLYGQNVLPTSCRR